MLRTALAVLVALALSVPAGPVALAQGAPSGFGLVNGRNHPEITWLEAETEHFRIIYPERLAGIENEAGPIAEASYAALSANFGGVTFEDQIRIYLSDEDEIANGSAYPIGPEGYTTIWVHPNEFAEIWTGDVKWLRKVIAHELAHLFHFRAVRSPFGLLQNLLATPLPSFWAEGLAQYETERWDAARGDRWLRTAVFEDRLSYSDGLAESNGRLRYAVGNSQARFLAQTRGDSTIARLLAHRESLLGLGVHDFYRAFEETVGQPYRDFYEEWRRHVNVYYNTLAGQMERLDSLQAEPIPLQGQYLRTLAFSPDTSLVAVVARTSLARPVTRLYVRNNPGAGTSRYLKVLAEGAIRGPISWSPDGRRIAYARNLRGEHGSLVNDLFVVDVVTGERTRLTQSRRAISPSFGPEGRRLAYAATAAGTNTANVFVRDLETGAETALTAFSGDVQITTARWQRGTDRIAFAAFDQDNRRDLWTVRADGSSLQRVTTGEGLAPDVQDSRIPVWHPSADSLAFTSLRDDIENAFVVGVGEGQWAMGDGEDEAQGSEAARGASGAAQPVASVPEAGASEPPPMTALSEAPPPRSPEPTPSAASIPSVPGEAIPSGDPSTPQPSDPPTLQETRVTALFNGATVHDWLPPDSLHPAGRLVVIATDTKRRDRAYVIDARRRPTVDLAEVEVPEAYALWTEHRPPLEVPFQIEPDSTAIQARGRYNALANLTHVTTLAFPVTDFRSQFGFFGTTTWAEPLGKHAFAATVSFSAPDVVEDTWLRLDYVNNTLAPSLAVGLFRYPAPGPYYGSSVLVERQTGADVTASLPLTLGDAPYVGAAASLRVRYAFAEPYALSEFENVLVTDDGRRRPEDGTRFTLRAAFAVKHQRPYRYNTLYPLDGAGARVSLTAALPVLGGDAGYLQPDAQAFWVSPGLGIGRLYVYGRAQARLWGDGLAQDYLGLTRYDDQNLQLPGVGDVGVGTSERVRGFRDYVLGDRVLFGRVEYRIAPVLDLDTSVLGLVRLGRVSPALFLDAAAVWTGSDWDGGVQRTGTGIEVKNVASLGGFEIVHALGLGLPTDRVFADDLVWDDVDLYYRVGAAIPF